VAESTSDKETKTIQENVVTRPRREVTIVLPEVKAPKFLQGFVDFIREQGVVGVAIGLILGFAASGLINSLVNNLINPFIGLVTGGIELDSKTACIKHVNGVCTTSLKYGQFLSDFISFVIILFTVYAVVKVLKLEKLKKKEAAK